MVNWVKTMDEGVVLCRVKVSTLDRAYRRTRSVRDLSEKYPEDSAQLEAAFESVHQLYTDAHNYSPGVPLSYSQFRKIGTRELPSWGRGR